MGNFARDIFSTLGYKTENALKYAKRCGDHHKTWQVIETIYVALVDELLVPFVRSAKEHGTALTCENFWKWVEQIKNQNYIYMYQMVFTFLHALILFRVGVRRGCFLAMNAGKDKLVKLFYAGNHPKYQRIMAVDKLFQKSMPEKVKDIIRFSFSTSRVGHEGRYQGGDACLEEINKNAKSWVSRGVPSNDEWIKIFRNLDKLSEVGN